MKGGRVHESRELVSAYFEHWRTNDDALAWAYDRVSNEIRKKPIEGWELVLALIAAAPNDEALDYVAAGPLEDWLCRHGGPRVAQVSDQAHRDLRFRRALGATWGRNRMSKELAAAIDKLVGAGAGRA